MSPRHLKACFHVSPTFDAHTHYQFFVQIYTPIEFYANELSISSDMHNTTTNNGRHVVDPQGWHGTFAFKASDQLLREYHVASHGYTNGKEDFALKEATHTSEKADSTRRGGPRSDKVVWPPEEFLEEYEDSPIGYSHLSTQS